MNLEPNRSNRRLTSGRNIPKRKCLGMYTTLQQTWTNPSQGVIGQIQVSEMIGSLLIPGMAAAAYRE